MIEDARIYLILHAPFLAAMLWLAVSEWQCRAVRWIVALFALAHGATILSYLAHWGDDLAIGLYQAMYPLVPAVLVYAKIALRRPVPLRRKALVLAVALAVPFLGIAALFFYLLTFPID